LDTYRGLEDLPERDTSVLTIGTFDGLHLGHQAVLREVVHYGKARRSPAVVITFDPHPQHVLAAPGEPRKELLVSPGRKIRLFEKLGVDILLILPFDQALSQAPAHEFLKDWMVGPFHPSRIVVGYDHHFGRNGAGDADFLQKFAGEFHYDVQVVAGVNLADMTVSSTGIRKLLKSGRCEQAEQLLGRPYELEGRTVRGAERGRELGFPTANLILDEPVQLVPRQAVYVVSANIDNRPVVGMCNIGVRPTFNGRTQTIEAHFFDLPNQDFYDRRLTFRFHHRLRNEKKFSNINELKRQLKEDKQEALAWVSQYQGGHSIHAIDT